VPLGDAGDGRQLAIAHDGPGRIVRSVQVDRRSALGDRLFERRFQVEAGLVQARPQRDLHGDGAA
jgi:hypothetical protein